MDKPIPEAVVDALYDELFRVGRYLHAPVPIDPKGIIRRHLTAAQQQGQAVAEAQARVPSYDALLIIAQSVCGALERAGITDCDDPGEAIDVLRERYEVQAHGGAGSPRLATPEQVGLFQGPDDCPHLQLNGVSVAIFPAGSWSDVCSALDSITGSTAPPSAPVGGGKKWPDDYCPECGSSEVHHREGEHIQCGACGQEYFTDIDYSDVVRENLKRLFALAQQPAADGGFTAADMMDARQEGRKEAQQPAAVDGAMVEVRKLARAMRMRSLDGATRSALLYADDLREYADRLLAIATQHQEPTT